MLIPDVIFNPTKCTINNLKPKIYLSMHGCLHVAIEPAVWCAIEPAVSP